MYLSLYQRSYISKLPKACPIADKGELCRMSQSQVVFDRALSILSKTNFYKSERSNSVISEKSTKKKISYMQIKEVNFFYCHSSLSSSVRCFPSKVS